MPLFQPSVLKKFLSQLDSVSVLQAYEKYCLYFHNSTIQDNIRNSKEEQFQEGFLRELFVSILGYTLNPAPNFNLTTEYKNVKDSKKADGAILVNDKVSAVIELKGTNTTDLGKIEAQAFGYKNNQPECVYVITSNFEKLRFYIDNAIEHIEFNLFTLTEKEFQLLYLCLGYENLSQNSAKKIKDESLSQEDVITKKLYKDYSLFKRELHHNLVQLNPEFEPLELFKKSQKLLDRFLFLFFGEDRHLLPPNSVRLILNQWNQLKDLDEYSPLYDRFKKYFGYLNTGYKGTQHDVFAYNGGLFKPDSILDTIKIDDNLLYSHTLKLSEYDFASEVDVNILGHIFENSLNELDEIKAQLEGAEIDKTKTKRKKDGVFYTPKYITKYIVENTVGKLCNEKKIELGIADEDYTADKKRQKKTVQTLVEKLEEYRKWLLQLTICDPACGSGAFLNQALDFLIAEHQYIDELQAKLFGDGLVLSDMENSILENNLFGVDLNEESVEIAKLSLWLRTAQPNRKLNDLNSNIKCGNSLIDDPAIAGDKAFNWQRSFPTIFKEKNKKAFHITTAIHDSRTSQRMIDFKVREKRDMGTNPYPKVCYLEPEDEAIITKTISEIVVQHQLNLLQYNICKDHMHLVLVCEEEEVPVLMQLIKGKTARVHNSSKGINPLVQKENEKAVPLWTQKFGCKEITTPEQLYNTIEYVKHNRTKHELAAHPKATALVIENMLCTQEAAFTPEYKGGFDVIVGNPPYGASFNNLDKTFIKEKYISYQYKFESYLYFYEKGINILNDSGYLSYITPELFLRLEKSENIRKLLLENSNVIEVKFCGENVFADVKVNSVVLTLNKQKPNDEYLKIVYEDEKHLSFLKERWRKSENYILEYEISDDTNLIIDKIISNSCFLGNLGDCIQGLTAYDSYRGQSQEIIKNRAYHFKEKIDDSCGKWLDGKHLNRYYLSEGDEWLKYGDWLAAPREPIFFENPRILFREIPGQNKRVQAVYTDEKSYYGHSITPFILNDNSYNIFFILSIVNSKLISWYASQKCSNFSKKTFPKLNPKDIKEFPIKNIPFENQQPFIEKADQMLSLNKELQEAVSKFQRSLQRKFFSTMGLNPLDTKDMGKKLQDWYLLTYAEFIKELAKKKVKLSLSEEAEWEEYFNQESKKALDLKAQIDATDKAIDAMVYALYGLSEEEISIVENS